MDSLGMNIDIKEVRLERFVIADLGMEISLSGYWNIDLLLPSFVPFKVNTFDELPIVAKVALFTERLDFRRDTAKLLSDISIVWGDRFTFWESDDHYWTVVGGQAIDEDRWVMRSSKDFKENRIQVGKDERESTSLLSWFCMVAFAQSGLYFKNILFHSSVVYNDDVAFGFLGKSGTGKSTHSRLWLKYIEGFSLLNDDNPAIRIMPDGEIRVFGTPWSGKTPCYKNESRPLGGLVRLKQAPFNQFDLKKNRESLIALLPSCSAIRWNKELYAKLVDLLIELVGRVPVGELMCLPNREAAELSSKKLLNYKLSI